MSGGSTGSLSKVDPNSLKALKWRLVGPFRGGRVVAVSGDPVNPQIFYFGSTGGGVWKTYDGGRFWENVSDGYFKCASVGGLEVAPSDPNVIYAGWASRRFAATSRTATASTSRPTPGRAGRRCGLEQTRNIGKIRVHPTNPDIVYVAAFGHALGPNQDRGLYRSNDGGENWDRVLFRSDKAGAIELSIDPTNPRILYATFWEAFAGPYWSAAVRAARSSARSTAAIAGTTSAATRVCRRDVSARSGSQPRRRSRVASGRWSSTRMARSTAPTTTAHLGEGLAKTATCASAPGTTTTSMPIRPTPIPSGS